MEAAIRSKYGRSNKTLFYPKMKLRKTQVKDIKNPASGRGNRRQGKEQRDEKLKP